MDADRSRSAIDFAALNKRTPARLGVGHAGPRYPTDSMLKLRADHARALDAVANEIAPDWPKRQGLIELQSSAATHDIYLHHPELGRRLSRESEIALRKVVSLDRKKSRRDRTTAKPSVMICVGDGLSSAAVERNAIALLRTLKAFLAPRYTILPAIFIRHARVRIQDQVGAIARADLVCLLIGERPGLGTAESLSAYVIYRPTLKSLEPDRTVVSNIHATGLKIPVAAAKIASLIDQMIAARASGSRLARVLAQGSPR
jgi:ethanolamine ammonia-lyase small subunit